jgi:hypothetical protein
MPKLDAYLRPVQRLVNRDAVPPRIAAGGFEPKPSVAR